MGGRIFKTGAHRNEIIFIRFILPAVISIHFIHLPRGTNPAPLKQPLSHVNRSLRCQKTLVNTEAKRCFATHDEDNDYFNMRIYFDIRNRSNKTYSARLTRWLDRLAHFDINIKHIAGKHLKITELPDAIETNNTNIQTRKSSRIRTNNPIIRYGNPVTF